MGLQAELKKAREAAHKTEALLEKAKASEKTDLVQAMQKVKRLEV